MHENFSEKDIECMQIALEQAKISSARGDLPVGAVLTIDGNVIGKSNNSNTTKKNWTSHAELLIINQFSAQIRKAYNEKREINIYTTLEPCIMCFGTSVMNRITNIIYACPDPNGGASHYSAESLKQNYSGHWPKIKSGLFSTESYDLLIKFMQNKPIWDEVRIKFEELGKTNSPQKL